MFSCRRFAPALILPLLLGSSGWRFVVEPIVAHAITITSAPLIDPKIEMAPELRFVQGWALQSPDSDFGGFSALQSDGHNFLAVSDKGLITRFTLDAAGKISEAQIQPLPKGCAGDVLKSDRDSESITRDAITGTYWIGFEWSNSICLADPSLRKAQAVSSPHQMREWGHTNGPEAMVHLTDGRFLVLQERPNDGTFTGPALLFSDDPTRADAKGQQLSYILPAPYFRPSDAVQLPDGRLLILHRHFKPPVSFEAKLAIMDKIPPHPKALPNTRVVATLSRTGIADNFEGVAINQEGSRTFVWLISDDNYLWIQHSYLLQFELVTPAQK